MRKEKGKCYHHWNTAPNALKELEDDTMLQKIWATHIGQQWLCEIGLNENYLKSQNGMKETKFMDCSQMHHCPMWKNIVRPTRHSDPRERDLLKAKIDP
jgi:hypothetical protein